MRSLTKITSTIAVAALLSGFVFETVAVWWGVFAVPLLRPFLGTARRVAS